MRPREGEPDESNRLPATSVLAHAVATDPAQAMNRSLRLLGRLLLIAALAFGASACAREEQPPAGRAATAPSGEVALDALPREAQQTLALIRQGGPFPYRKDGSVFGNRERLLPKQRRGYYTEYTVPTPGSRDRGARRIVAGKGATGDPATGGEYYYSDDHYQSFRRIRP
jgi:ribonuclease T1